MDEGAWGEGEEVYQGILSRDGLLSGLRGVLHRRFDLGLRVGRRDGGHGGDAKVSE